MTTTTPRNSTPAWQAKVTWKRRDYRVWCDLRLMPSVKHVCLIPRWGKDLIIVAAVDNVLHFRMFDGDGKSVVDVDEKRLTVPARQIEDLRKHLVGLWPPHELTASEKDRVITAVTSIVGYTRHLEAEYAEQRDRGAPQGETKPTQELAHHRERRFGAGVPCRRVQRRRRADSLPRQSPQGPVAQLHRSPRAIQRDGGHGRHLGHAARAARGQAPVADADRLPRGTGAANRGRPSRGDRPVARDMTCFFLHSSGLHCRSHHKFASNWKDRTMSRHVSFTERRRASLRRQVDRLELLESEIQLPSLFQFLAYRYAPTRASIASGSGPQGHEQWAERARPASQAIARAATGRQARRPDQFRSGRDRALDWPSRGGRGRGWPEQDGPAQASQARSRAVTRRRPSRPPRRRMATRPEFPAPGAR